MYRSRVCRLIADEHPGEIAGQRGRATVEEGAYRIRTGRSEWPRTQPGKSVDPRTVAGRRRVACVCCATEGWDRDFKERSWVQLCHGWRNDARQKFEELLSARKYSEWAATEGLLVPPAEVRRAGVRMAGSREVVLLHKRQVVRSGALVWNFYRCDMVLDEQKPLPWCGPCWAAARSRSCPQLALANGLRGAGFGIHGQFGLRV